MAGCNSFYSQQLLGSESGLKRPWLLTPRGQRTAMHLANLVSLAMFLSFVFYFALVENPRSQVLQLDPENISYCEIGSCPKIQGLEITNGASATAKLEERAFGQLLTLELTNHEMLSGSRELWLKVESPDGRVLEMASVVIELGLKNRTIAEFLLVSEKSLILDAKLSLGY
jgi:hypothetical protein